MAPMLLRLPAKHPLWKVALTDSFVLDRMVAANPTFLNGVGCETEEYLGGERVVLRAERLKTPKHIPQASFAGYAFSGNAGSRNMILGCRARLSHALTVDRRPASCSQDSGL